MRTIGHAGCPSFLIVLLSTALFILSQTSAAATRRMTAVVDSYKNPDALPGLPTGTSGGGIPPMAGLGHGILGPTYDRVPPEAVISWERRTGEISVYGIDNLDESLNETQELLSSSNNSAIKRYTFVDDWMNAVVITLRLNTSGNIREAKVLEFDYVIAGFLTRSIVPPDNLYKVNFKAAEDASFELTHQNLYVSGSFSAQARENKQLDMMIVQYGGKLVLGKGVMAPRDTVVEMATLNGTLLAGMTASKASECCRSPPSTLNFWGDWWKWFKDDDGDGLPYIFELFLGTNPKKPDTDSDGLEDGWKDMNGDGKTEGYSHTSPTNRDTDGDGFCDAWCENTGNLIFDFMRFQDPSGKWIIISDERGELNQPNGIPTDPTIPDRNVLVILVGFIGGEKISVAAKTVVDSLFGRTKDAQTMNNYYMENSHNGLGITGTVVSVTIPQAPHPGVNHQRDYASDGGLAGTVDQGTVFNDPLCNPVNNPVIRQWCGQLRLIRDSVAMYDSIAPGYTGDHFDRDNDGKIDHVLIVQAGGDQSDTEDGTYNDNDRMWPVTWGTPAGLNFIAQVQDSNGNWKSITHGAVVSEDSFKGVACTGTVCTGYIGTVYHEFAHDLGHAWSGSVMDLYHDPSFSGVPTTFGYNGQWDLMSYGNRLVDNQNGNYPSEMGAFTKYELDPVQLQKSTFKNNLKVIDPTILTETNLNDTICNLIANGTQVQFTFTIYPTEIVTSVKSPVQLLRVDSPIAKDGYYMVEVRMGATQSKLTSTPPDGRTDNNNENRGVLIWHVESSKNACNILGPVHSPSIFLPHVIVPGIALVNPHGHAGDYSEKKSPAWWQGLDSVDDWDDAPFGTAGNDIDRFQVIDNAGAVRLEILIASKNNDDSYNVQVTYN